MKQYKELLQKIMSEGVDVKNERTGAVCRTIINHDMEYDVGSGEFPLVTLRRSYYKAAIAELLGYLRGFDNAQQFADLGAKTWFANANETKAWLDNPNRKGDGDVGRVYGVVARDFGGINLIQEVYDDLRQGKDSRGEIITFWKPDEFDKGALRPCMYSHHFSILDGTLYLNSTQRSCDVPLGLNFNMVQCYILLALMAQITGLKPGKVYHKIVNAHIYENQIPAVEEMLYREPYPSPTITINPAIRDLKDLETWVTPDDFQLFDYQFHPAISIPFTE